MRADPRDGAIILVLPRRATLAAGLGFARSQASWIRGHLARLPPPLPFAPGLALSVLGTPLVIRHDPTHRGATCRDGDHLRVGGDPQSLPRRVRDFLRAEARRVIVAVAIDKARRIDRPIAALRIVDTRSRWGSCAIGGRLSFSWRLVLAPAAVLDYVVAHEVAHLVHHDHGARFWLLVDRLTDQRSQAQGWLRRHGTDLLRIGAR